MKKALTPEKMMKVLCERIDSAGGPYRFARANDIDLGYLSRVLRGLHPIGGKVLNSINIPTPEGIRRYRKIITVSYEEEVEQ